VARFIGLKRRALTEGVGQGGPRAFRVALQLHLQPLEGGPVWAGSTLITVTCSRPAGKILGSVRLEAIPAIDTAIGLETASPTLEALGTQIWTIFEAFRLTFPQARD
jgi:hypothetical protein